jgi:hypothetical protein
VSASLPGRGAAEYVRSVTGDETPADAAVDASLREDGATEPAVTADGVDGANHRAAGEPNGETQEAHSVGSTVPDTAVLTGTAAQSAVDRPGMEERTGAADDAWPKSPADGLPFPLPSYGPSGPPHAQAPPMLRRWPFRLALGLAILFAILAGLASYVAWENRERAESWEARALRYEAVAGELRVLVGERTQELNRTTETANDVARRLRETRAALSRSTSDVSQLSARQRELANEKAQIEDERQALEQERDALESVAGSFVTCNEGLFGILNAVLEDDYSYVSYYGQGVLDDCRAADAGLDDYLAAYLE